MSDTAYTMPDGTYFGFMHAITPEQLGMLAVAFLLLLLGLMIGLE